MSQEERENRVEELLAGSSSSSSKKNRSSTSSKNSESEMPTVSFVTTELLYKNNSIPELTKKYERNIMILRIITFIQFLMLLVWIAEEFRIKIKFVMRGEVDEDDDDEDEDDDDDEKLVEEDDKPWVPSFPKAVKIYADGSDVQLSSILAFVALMLAVNNKLRSKLLSGLAPLVHRITLIPGATNKLEVLYHLGEPTTVTRNAELVKATPVTLPQGGRNRRFVALDGLPAFPSPRPIVSFHDGHNLSVNSKLFEYLRSDDPTISLPDFVRNQNPKL
eukprot:TRINITY_DN2310_c0_g2_i1.p1 TRINITY_DN2310_c0_g2~~TRINITY_DN2310_c0_g2_i1.p1  ORF type:complete len:308 (+),score=76.26 TRINITY_DN2310_c0_g2_i1:97-924(+)